MIENDEKLRSKKTAKMENREKLRSKKEKDGK